MCLAPRYAHGTGAGPVTEATNAASRDDTPCADRTAGATSNRSAAIATRRPLFERVKTNDIQNVRVVIVVIGHGDAFLDTELRIREAHQLVAAEKLRLFVVVGGDRLGLLGLIVDHAHLDALRIDSDDGAFIGHVMRRVGTHAGSDQCEGDEYGSEQ